VATPEPLACPHCARRFSLDERFCPDDGMPLVYVGRGEEEPITEAQERARKVKPQYTSGDLVKVAWARNLSEAELIQGILLDQGIPSVQRRSRGFDVPDFLAAGPRDILVPEAAGSDARELLTDADAPEPAVASDEGRAIRLLAGMAVALVLAAAIVWALYQLVG
jgi:glutaredoxin